MSHIDILSKFPYEKYTICYNFTIKSINFTIIFSLEMLEL